MGFHGAPSTRVQTSFASPGSSQTNQLKGSCQIDDVSTSIGSSSAMMTSATSIDRGDRFPADVIEQAV
jgi:hypothetical protein